MCEIFPWRIIKILYGRNITRVHVYVHIIMYETLTSYYSSCHVYYKLFQAQGRSGLPDPKGSLSQSVDLLSTCALQSPHMILHLHALKTANRLSIAFTANDQ